MSNTAAIAKFTKKIVDTGTVLQKTQREAVQAAAMATKVAFLAAPGAPHMVAKKKASVGFDVKEGRTTYAMVSWRGPVHLVNNPTKPHVIRPRQFKGTRATGARAQKGAALLAAFGVDARSSGSGGIKLRDGQVRRSVMHPGTKGKHFFQKGKTVAERVAPDVWARTNRAALAKHFAGG